MARYDVHPVSPRGTLALTVQADLLDGLGTCVVVPLLSVSEAPTPLKDLNPIFDIAGTRYVMVTQAIAAVPVKSLGTVIVSLGDHQDMITKALDMLFSGYYTAQL